MKKWFDRLFIGKLSIQLIAVVLAIGFISVFSGILLNVYSRHAIFGDNFFIQSLKGFFQLIDNSDAKETLNSFENIVKKDPGQELYAPVIILISLFVWMLGTVLFSFITAAFANAFDARNRLIASGAIRYKFSGRHGIIIGWDFTAISLVRNLLNQHHAKEIAILSALSSELIRDELRQEFSQQELKRIYVFQGDCFSQTDIDSLCAWNAGTVFITGHKQSECDCSSNIKIYTLVENSIDKKIGYWSDFPRFEAELPLKHPFVFKLISFKPNYFVWSIFTKLRYRTTQQFLQEPLPNFLYKIGKKIYYPRTPVKIFPDISNTTVFTKVFNPATAGHIVAYPYNYCTAAFRELYCGLPQNKNNAFFHYTPLKFRRGAKNGVHLLLSGFNDMARAIITESLRIIPENECKITIFLSDEKERRSCDLFIRTVIGDNSGGCCITVLPYDICHPAVRDSFTAAIKDDNTSTTLFITGHKTDEVLQTFSVLAEKIGHWNVQAVLEQRVRSKMVVPRDRIQKNSTCRVNYLGLLDHFCTTLDMQMEISKKTFIRQNGLNENSTDLDSFFWNCRYQDKRQQAEDFALAIPEKLYQCNYAPGDGDLREIIRSLKGIHIPTGIFRNTVGILPSSCPESMMDSSSEKSAVFQRGIREQLRNCGAICGFIENQFSREIMTAACFLSIPVIGLSKKEKNELLDSADEQILCLLHNLQYFVKVDQKCSEELLIINHCDLLLSANDINFDHFLMNYFETGDKASVFHGDLDKIIPPEKAKRVCFILREKFDSNFGNCYDDWLESFPLCRAGESENEPELLKNNRDYQNNACVRIGRLHAECNKHRKALEYYAKTVPERCSPVEKAILILWLFQCEILSGESGPEIKNISREILEKFTAKGKDADEKTICSDAIKILRQYSSNTLFREYLLQLYEIQAHLYFNSGKSASSVCNGTRDLLKALKLHKKVFNERLKKYGLQHKKTSKSHLNIAQCYIELKKYSFAKELLEYALEFRCRMFGDDSLEVAYVKYFLAVTFMQTKKYEEAEKFASAALDISEKRLGGNHSKTIIAKCLLDKIKKR